MIVSTVAERLKEIKKSTYFYILFELTLLILILTNVVDIPLTAFALFSVVLLAVISIVTEGTRLNRSRGGNTVMVIVLGLFGTFSAYPLLFALNNAFKPFDEIFLFPPELFVRNPTMDNINSLVNLLANSWVPTSRYFFNTVLITLLGTLGHVLVASMAAYPLAKYKFFGSKLLFTTVVFSLMFSPQVTQIPNYMIMSSLGMVDTLSAIIVPAFGYSLGLYLMKQFMEQIPMALIESVKIDGGSDILVFFKIVMPIVKPAWLTLIILLFQQMWKTDGGLFIYTESLKPLSYALQQVILGGIARMGTSAAVALFMMSVPIVIFIFTQSNIINTMAYSGLKE